MACGGERERRAGAAGDSSGAMVRSCERWPRVRAVPRRTQQHAYRVEEDGSTSEHAHGRLRAENLLRRARAEPRSTSDPATIPATDPAQSGSALSTEARWRRGGGEVGKAQRRVQWKSIQRARRSRGDRAEGGKEIARALAQRWRARACSRGVPTSAKASACCTGRSMPYSASAHPKWRLRYNGHTTRKVS